MNENKCPYCHETADECESVVQKEDVITYVGNGIWSVSKDE